MALNTNYSPIALGDTAGLTNDVWAGGWRQHGPFYYDPSHPLYIPFTIGGSSSPCIEDASPWMSKEELYREKTGTTKPGTVKRPMNQEILDNGHYLEEYVAQKFIPYMVKNAGISANCIEMWNDTMMYQHPLFPWCVANLDRRIRVNGVEGILEIKTTGNKSDIYDKWMKGICPDKYVWQCRFYMAVMNVDYCYIACMWGFTLDEMAVIKIERDLAVEEMFMEDIQEFVECCEFGVEPPAQMSHKDTLLSFRMREVGPVKTKNPPLDLPMTEDTQDLFNRILDFQEQREALEKRIAAMEDEEAGLIAELMDYTGAGTAYANLRMNDDTVVGVKIKFSKHKDGFDEERFAADHPDIYKEFLVAPPTEPKFDLAACKKRPKYKGICSQYVIEGETKVIPSTKSERPKIEKVEVKNIPLAPASNE